MSCVPRNKRTIVVIDFFFIRKKVENLKLMNLILVILSFFCRWDM